MKIELNDIAELPEGLSSIVETDGDKSVIDLSKVMPTEDLSGLKSALAKERENAQRWAQFESPEAVSAKLAKLEKAAQGVGKTAEDAQAKLDAIAAEKDAEIAKRDERLTKMMQSNAQASLKAELAKAGVIADGIDMLATFAGQRIQFNDDGTPRVLTSEGKPMIGSGPDHGATLADLAKELAENTPFLVKDSGLSGGGKQPGTGGTPKTAKNWGEAKTAKEKAALLKDKLGNKE